MMRIAMQYVLGTLALPLADYLLVGFWCNTMETALLAGAVLMLLYLLLRPVLRLLLGLFNLLTLGALYIALDTGLIYLLTLLFPGMVQYKNLWWAAAAALIVNTVRLMAGMIFRKSRK